MLLYAIRTAAESMAVTPLRLTNAVGMPWRRVCSFRSAQARAGSSAINAKRRKRAAVERWVQAMDRGKTGAAIMPSGFFAVLCTGIDAVLMPWRTGSRVQRKASLLWVTSAPLAGARMAYRSGSGCSLEMHSALP